MFGFLVGVWLPLKPVELLPNDVFRDVFSDVFASDVLPSDVLPRDVLPKDVFASDVLPIDERGEPIDEFVFLRFNKLLKNLNRKRWKKRENDLIRSDFKKEKIKSKTYDWRTPSPALLELSPIGETVDGVVRLSNVL